MKVLMLGWELPPHNSGGLGVACYQLAEALAGHGAKIDFILPRKHPIHKSITFMNVHGLDNPAELSADAGLPIPKPVSESMFQAGAYDPFSSDIIIEHEAYTKQTLKFVNNQNYDVMHAHDWLTLGAAMEIKKLHNLPLIAHVHATEFDRAGGSTGHPLIHEIEQNGLLMADLVVAVSHRTKQHINEAYGIPLDKIVVMHNSIDLNDFTSYVDGGSYRYIQQRREEGYLIVTTMGRLTTQKGLEYFLRAAAKASQRLDKFVFVVGGDGELRNELLMQSAQLGIASQVVFTGFVRGKKWRDLYKESDIFVMSSVSEPFGLTALEAAAHDSALILTNQSGVSEVLDHALRYDFWDEDRLADQLINLASSQSLTPLLKKSAYEELRGLSWDSVARYCMDRYAHLTSGVSEVKV